MHQAGDRQPPLQPAQPHHLVDQGLGHGTAAVFQVEVGPARLRHPVDRSARLADPVAMPLRALAPGRKAGRQLGRAGWVLAGGSGGGNGRHARLATRKGAPWRPWVMPPGASGRRAGLSGASGSQ
mmetsp:Transcript_44560/g.104669  ORF Transcript_44560/g.104669 Transcript_44560/m.104669 type:complete len:125 (+) Transcript_44560:178-552(+)